MTFMSLSSYFNFKKMYNEVFEHVSYVFYGFGNLGYKFEC